MPGKMRLFSVDGENFNLHTSLIYFCSLLLLMKMLYMYVVKDENNFLYKKNLKNSVQHKVLFMYMYEAIQIFIISSLKNILKY